MDLKARLHDVTRDLSGGFRVTFATQDDIRGSLESLQGVDLRLNLTRWRRTRSHNANAYYYALLGKIAQRARTTTTEAHNRTIADYGQPDTDAGVLLLRDDVDWTRLEALHLKPVPGVEVVGDDLYRRYLIMRGSHTYDTAEMAALIEGTIAEAKALGIETLTPRELTEMMRAYEINHRKKRD